MPKGKAAHQPATPGVGRRLGHDREPLLEQRRIIELMPQIGQQEPV